MIIGIICEYNPFHNGHLYQIERIREEFGEDTGIIAVMSGNFVQRGGVAIADKGVRAICAELSGVNLVLELPFPFSMSSAEFFARSAVHILDSLGCVDYISFGSESGSIEALEDIANAMLSNSFIEEMNLLSRDENEKKRGYAALCESALRKVLNADVLDVTLTPNNILAIEYIKALKELKSNIKPHTIKRVGNAFSDETFSTGDIQSATSIRHSIESKDISALEYTPNITKEILLKEVKNGDFPCDSEKLSTAIITSLRLNSSAFSNDIHDTAGGLYNRLRELSFEANTLDGLIRSAETKKFTRARIRRALFYTLLGVTSSHVKALPAYTQLLATDLQGRTMLKTIRKHSSFPILTKPSDTKKLSEEALMQKKMADSADSVFQLTKPIPKDGNLALRFTPFVRK